MGNTYFSKNYEYKTCSKCLRNGSWLQPITPCVHCQNYLCVHCSKPIQTVPCTSGLIFPRIKISALGTPRCCFSCRSPLLSLNDEILRYIMLFLTYKNQDRLLRVCTRFHSVLLLPYQYLKNIEEKYLWKDPYDILYASRRSIVLRGVDRLTGISYALKLIPKSQMLSRRLWQKLHQNIGIRCAVSKISTFFPSFYYTFQTRDFIILVMEFIPPEKYETLSSLISSGKITEKDSRLIISKILEAVCYLHDNLHIVHRELSPDAIFISRNNFEDIRILHFHNSRFLKPSSHSSYLQEMREQQEQQQQQQQQEQQNFQKKTISVISNSTNFELEEDKNSINPINNPSNIPISVAGTTTTVNNTLSPQMTKNISRPPPLCIPVDIGLMRKAGIYAKVAREREAQLQEAATRSQGFSHSTFDISQRYCTSSLIHYSGNNGGVIEEVMEGVSSVSNETPPPPLNFNTLEVKNSLISTKHNNENNNNNNNNNNNSVVDDVDDDDFIIVATPRSAVSYAAPELSTALCALSVMPTLTIKANDVKKWDVYAIGGIFYQLLSSSVQRFNNSNDSLDWDSLSNNISGESIVLLFLLMHVDSRQRLTCREALNLLWEQFRNYTSASVIG